MLTSYQAICDLENTPLEEQPIGDSIYSSIKQNSERYPDKTALYYFESYSLNNNGNPKSPVENGEIDISYSELLKNIHQLANLCFDISSGKDAVISILAANHPDTAYSLLAAPTFGCACPVNYLLEPKAIADIIDAADSEVLIAAGSHPALDIAEKLPDITERSSKLKKIVILGDLDNSIEQVIKANGIEIFFFEKEKSNYSSEALNFEIDQNLDRVYAMFHTGGTTGTPKLVMQTERNQLVFVWLARQIADTKASDFTMTGLPLFHVNAAIGSLVGALTAGSSLLLAGLNGYRSPGVLEHFFEFVARFKITSFSAVPTIYAALMQLPTEHLDLSALRYAICGAAPMPVELFKAFEEKTGLRVIEGYGLTEGTAGCCLNLPDGEPRVGSIGHRFPYVDLIIAEIDQDNQFIRECETNEVGNILLRGPIVSLGYKQKERNKELWVNTNGERWLNTGDLARIDKEHYIWLAGRKKELIIRGGHNIDPKAIEDVLASHPAVLLAAAVGRPDAHAGELPVAYVAVNEAVSDEDLLNYCQQHIGERAAVPKAITIDNNLPVTAVGKIFKPALIKREIAYVLNSDLSNLGLHPGQFEVKVIDDKRKGVIAQISLLESNHTLTNSIKKLQGTYSFLIDII